MHFAFFQPDIPQNVGAALRLSACLNVPFHIIEPCGFLFTDKRIRQSGLDYLTKAQLIRHTNWTQFLHNRNEANNKSVKTGFLTERKILFSTKAQQSCYDFSFQPNDMLIFGRETAGVPNFVSQNITHAVCIPLHHCARSLNLVTATAIGLSEALRQTGRFEKVQKKNKPPPRQIQQK